LALTGLARTDLGSALIGRFNNRSNFVARRRVVVVVGKSCVLAID
jgi:hypothetical protein